MKEKVFYRVLGIVTCLGILSMLLLLAFTIYLYKDCSIISYIANRG
ncbi:MAG: hypothetical protein IKQ28_08765 [Lachnospiraceae bacterium]|nr:hypothetical protein [Lachnospiraceae bacterium]